MATKNRSRKALPSATPSCRLTEAIHETIKELAAAPTTPGNLMKLEQFVRISREQLVVLKQPEALRRPPKLSSASMVAYGNNPGYDAPLPDEDTGVTTTFPMTSNPINSVETFGATIVREVIPALTAMMHPKPIEFPMDPVRAIEAIAKAKKAGLHDVAAALKEKLIGGKLIASPTTLPAVTLRKNGSSTKPALSLPEAS